MKSFFITPEKEQEFKHSQLNTNWLEERFGIKGNSIIGFMGPFTLQAFFKNKLGSISEFLAPSDVSYVHFVIEMQYVTPTELKLIQFMFCSICRQVLGPEYDQRGSRIYLSGISFAMSSRRFSHPSSFIHVEFMSEPLPMEPMPLGVKIMQLFCKEINWVFEKSEHKQ